MAIIFQLESSSETLNLNEVATSGSGVQAIAGATGLGLPPVDVSFAEGAGDGAVYRSTRVLPRDIDFELYFVGPNRAGLKTQVAKLSRILAESATLRIIDDADQWTVPVVRVGGGDFAYGDDTDGELDLTMSLTLRATTPYWTYTTATSVTQNHPSIGPTMNLSQDGTAPTYPVWEIRGPGINFTATSARGEVLQYQALVAENEIITIDTATGTVTDGSGNNRYAGLAPAPKFFPVRPGETTVTISFDNSSAAYTAATTGVLRTNRITNPELTSNSTGWTLTNSAARDTSSSPFNSAKILLPSSAGTATSTVPTAVTTCTGLTAGSNYELRIGTSYIGGGYGGAGIGTGWATIQYVVKDGTSGTVLASLSRSANWSNSAGGTRSDTSLVLPFVASSTSVTVTATATKSAAAVVLTGACDKFYLGEPGTYFDGSTATTLGKTYAWTGTSGNSTSTESATTTFNTAQTRVKGTVYKRNWMVI